jgi:hypothetical protein
MKLLGCHIDDYSAGAIFLWRQLLEKKHDVKCITYGDIVA